MKEEVRAKENTAGRTMWIHKAACLALCVLLCVLYVMPCAAAETDREGNLGENVQRLYTVSSGLPSTAATAIAQTNDGFIWIGGYGGLVRFDGRTFEPCLQGEIGSVQALLADSKGRFWIAANDSGLVLYENGRYLHLSELLEDRKLTAAALAEGKDGRIWFGTESGIGYIDDAMKVVMPDIPGLEGKYITHILPMQNGRILCVTRDGELFRTDGESAQLADLGADTEHVRSITYDERQKQFLAGMTDDRVLILDENLTAIRTVDTSSLTCINDVLVDKSGIVWLCADNGVGSYDGARVRIQSLNIDNSIDHIMIDREGNYWFVSSRQGVLEVCPCRFGNVSRSAGLENVVVNALAERDGLLYIGHDTGLLIINADSYEQVRDPAFSALKGVRIRSILNDGKGGLWFFTMKGALHFDRNNVCRVYSSKEYPQIASNGFRCGILDGDAVLTGTDNGAYRIDGDLVSNLTDPEQVLDCRVLSVGGTADHCWLGTDGYGLYELLGGRIVRHLHSENGLGSNVVMKIVPGRAQKGWWLVLGNGLVWMDVDGNISRIRAGSSANILDIVVLEDGRVWIPVGNGILYSTEEALLSGDDSQTRLYRSVDGIPYEITANSNQCLYKNTLYFCGTGGVESVRLENDTQVKKEYPLILDYILEDGEPVYMQNADQCRIQPNTHRIDFCVHVLTYQTENPEVYYYLEGFDTGRTVTDLASLGDITYTNLNAGNYVLHFGIVGEEGEEDLPQLSMSVVKLPHWYEQLWVCIAALVLGIALLILAVWLYIRRRMKNEENILLQRLEEEEKERLRQIAYQDYLTGLYNRNYLMEWKDSSFSQVKLPFYFVAIDCNDLKKVNDQYGHAAGDELLRKLSGILKEEFGEEGVIFRTGGDEFLLLIEGISREALEERIVTLHDMASQVRVRDVTLSFCEGVFEMDREISFDEGMTRADMDLLQKKDQFHGRV